MRDFYNSSKDLGRLPTISYTASTILPILSPLPGYHRQRSSIVYGLASDTSRTWIAWASVLNHPVAHRILTGSWPLKRL